MESKPFRRSLVCLCGLIALSPQLLIAGQQQPAFSFIAAGPEVFTRDLTSLGVIPEKATLTRLTALPVSNQELQYFGELQKHRPQIRIVLTDRERVLYCCPVKFDETTDKNVTIGIGLNSKEGLIVSAGPSFEKIGENEFHRSGKEPIYLRKQDDWLLISAHRENLEFPTKQIDKLLEGFDSKHRFRFTVHFENFTDEMHRDHLEQTDRFFKTLLKDRYQGGLPDETAMESVKMTRTLSAELRRDPENHTLSANVQFRFREGTQAAEITEAFAAERSKYEAIIDDEADLNAIVALELAPKYSAFCIKAWSAAAREVSKRPEASEPLVDSWIQALRTIGITTFNTGKLDLAISVKKTEQDWDFSFAGDFRYSELLQIHGEEVQESDSAARLRGLFRPAPEVEPKGRVWRYWDTSLAWFPKDRIVITSSPQRFAELQKIVKEPQTSGEPLPPLLIQGRVYHLRYLLAEHAPQFPAREKLLNALQGDERFQLAVQAQEGTLKLEVSLGEQAVLRYFNLDPAKNNSLRWLKLFQSAN